ncbi:MAG: DUF4440 domain-containing protein [Flavobacteriaceae bacterium]|nr:DUF4440 domain-containing protein [Flavobacteriaceae bacterium]
MRILFFSGLFLITTVLFSQKRLSQIDSLAIVKILYEQQEDWNRGDIDAFMQGYLKSDQLVFSGSSGPIYGWEATRNRYKKTYSDRQKMGKLKFDILNVIGLSSTVIQLQGKFNLSRIIGDIQGYFTLNWIKVNNEWFIISDHTSASKL